MDIQYKEYKEKKLKNEVIKMEKKLKEAIKKMKNEMKNDRIPILDILIDSTDVFLTELLNDMPYTYYVYVSIGNNHPEIISIPLEKTFNGGSKHRIDYSKILLGDGEENEN